MKNQPPDYSRLLDRIDMTGPLLGVYNCPEPEAFKPLVRPQPGECVFSFFRLWQEGKTLHLTKDHYGCGGCGRRFFGIEAMPMDNFLEFLVDGEGLKASHALMLKWIEHTKADPPPHPHTLLCPLKKDQWEHVLSVTFFANPDQLSALMIGAQYFSSQEDPTPVIAPFGSGCMQLLPFTEPKIPQAVIGTTDIAMRSYIPPDILAFTVTPAMFQQLCALDEKSFLYKPFLHNLRKARGPSGLNSS
jgi:hypothetical protein